MKPTEQLKEEHVAIVSLLHVMDRVCDKLEAGQPIDPAHLDQIAEFITVFADRCHHAKEEGLLFKAMQEAGIPSEGGPVGVMLAEHDVGRGYVREMIEGMAAYKSGDPGAAVKIAANARGYAGLLSQHIYKEDNILYPMADMHLSQQQQGELLAEFEKVEAEVVGPDKHEELERNLRHLEEVYLEAA